MTVTLSGFPVESAAATVQNFLADPVLRSQTERIRELELALVEEKRRSEALAGQVQMLIGTVQNLRAWYEAHQHPAHHGTRVRCCRESIACVDSEMLPKRSFAARSAHTPTRATQDADADLSAQEIQSLKDRIQQRRTLPLCSVCFVAPPHTLICLLSP